eukprot:scaffold3685_cov102-Isochrysis_galbana.AAC.10
MGSSDAKEKAARGGEAGGARSGGARPGRAGDEACVSSDRRLCAVAAPWSGTSRERSLRRGEARWRGRRQRARRRDRRGWPTAPGWLQGGGEVGRVGLCMGV